MKTKVNTKQLVMLGLLTAILLLMSYTPLGYLNIGPLAISFNVIPVAIAAVTLGPVGGAVVGAVFGLTSFLQCIGIGGTSQMGTILFGINPVLAFIQRFIPRLLDGFLLGFIFKGVRKISNTYVSCAVTGFFSAFLNTVFFMSALVFAFRQHRIYADSHCRKKRCCLYLCRCRRERYMGTVASTLITGAVGAKTFQGKTYPQQKQSAGINSPKG